MNAESFVRELDALSTEGLSPILGAGRTSIEGGSAADSEALLKIALANEISVSELAAAWVPSTTEIAVKLAFARQSGDEASHFRLVANRLSALGFDVASFQVPPINPLFDYMRSLSTTVERVTAGLYTLEAMAHGVNENFIRFCEKRGDAETVRIYRQYIQPDEKRHQQLGRELLLEHAKDATSQARARDVVRRVLETAAKARGAAASRLGTSCFPGC